MSFSPGASKTVCASAPGKVILFGEHAVVYGQPAVAAALSDLRIYVKITPKESQTITIDMADLPSPVHIELDSQTLLLPSLNEPPTHHDLEVIQKVLSSSSSALDELGTTAVTPLVYLLNKLVPNHLEQGLEVCVRSKDLPVGAGLGSSAAFSVACAAALVRLSLLETTTSSLPLGKPSSQHLKTIDHYAFYSEILLHGTPSGIDNAVSSYGGAIVFTKNTETNQTDMDHLDMPPLNMILTHTHVPRSTKALVAGVRTMYNRHTPVVQGMLDAMGAIAREFREIILSGNMTSYGEEMMTLVRTNQLLLRAVGVSHASLNYICRVVDEVAGHNAACKLTGAGGGGCAMTLLRPGVDEQMSTAIQSALQRRRHPPWKFSCFTSSVGGDGVLWISENEFANHQSVSTPREKLRRSSSLLLGAIAAAGVAAALLVTRRSLQRN